MILTHSSNLDKYFSLKSLIHKQYMTLD